MVGNGHSICCESRFKNPKKGYVMKKILQCLKKLTLPILLAVVLLAVQAQCDLALSLIHI